MNPYRLTQSRAWQGGRLLQFLRLAYGELTPGQDLEHLGRTVEQFYDPLTTPLWLLEHTDGAVGCLWLGQSLDQTNGQRAAYIFLVYVHPAHRRRGLATRLMEAAMAWATEQGLVQVHLQVLAQSAAALALYQKLGFVTRAYLLSRELLKLNF
ncbi:GNAT family N-acetyltransferase [Candidatus Cyanaurora vandensis]|uniref:GNAT family N-acetyltransferase n=1 Tax=Candidatus Cyanaurora vandensis TaxID=2714958 RepID=UPI00257B6B59|nr:GNAT family N-acetyltransferase [Candidatus Cyanaurora vandensis]